MFEIGQKVVCIEPDSDGDLVKDAIYTIHSFFIGPRTGPGVRLVEVQPSTNHAGFMICRFREIDDTWVEDLLCKIIEEVDTQVCVETINH